MSTVSDEKKRELVELIYKQKRVQIEWLSTITDIEAEDIIQIAKDNDMNIEGKMIVIPDYDKALDLIRQGEAYIKRNKLDVALRQFEKALEINSEISETWEKLGEYYLKHGKIMDKAFSHYNKAVEIEPEANLRIWVDVGNYCSEYRYHQQAVHAYQIALKCETPGFSISGKFLSELDNEDFVMEYMMLSSDFIAKGDMKLVVHCLETALEINAKNIEVLRILGGIYIDFHEELEDHTKGISFYEKILEIDSKDGASWGGIGALLIIKGDVEKGKEYLKTALELDPNNFQASILLDKYD
ncbi:MAG: tetratricopeptide repeat protein [Candidatus Heimdallarchaeota archaeon]